MKKRNIKFKINNTSIKNKFFEFKDKKNQVTFLRREMIKEKFRLN